MVELDGFIFGAQRLAFSIQHSAFSSQPRQKPWATDIGVLRHRRRAWSVWSSWTDLFLAHRDWHSAFSTQHSAVSQGKSLGQLTSGYCGIGGWCGQFGRFGRIYFWRTETLKTELIADRVDAAGRRTLPVTRYPWPLPTTAPLPWRLGWFRRTDRAGISR